MVGTRETTRVAATIIGIGAILLWAFLAPLTVFAAGLPTFQILAMSFGTAFVSGCFVLGVRGREALAGLRQPLAPWMTAFVAIFGYHALYFYALSAAPAAEASLIAYLWPLFIVLLSSLLPGEHLLVRHVAGALLGLGGTALIVLGREASAQPGSSLAGYAAAFACAFVWSSYSVFNRRFVGTASTMIIGVCGAVAVAGAALHLALEETVPPTTAQWLATVLLGIGPTGLAFLAWDHATKLGHVSLLGALSYLSPLLSTLLLVIMGRAPATPQLAMAVALIVGGALLAAGWRRRKTD